MSSVTPTLRDYQHAASAAVWDAYAQGHNRVLVKKPTGTGKTVWFASLLAYPPLVEWLARFPERERKMLVIAHREELLTQAQAKILAQHPELRVSIEQGELVASRFSDVVVASIQTLAAVKFRRLKRLMSQHGPFRIVIVDEAHHAAASTYRTALALLGFLPMADASDEENVEAAGFDDVEKMEQALAGWDAEADRDRILIGVTATPNRSDMVGLNCVFQEIAYSYALKDAIDDGWLVPVLPWVINTQTSLDDVRVKAGEFVQTDLAAAVNNPARNALAVAGWHEHAVGRSTIAFTVDVQHAHDLAAEFNRQGVKAEALSGETPKDYRRAMLARFMRGELPVITNCMVLTEGTDLPLASCILHAKPTRSPTLYEQMTGRGLRVHPDDPAGPTRAGAKRFIKPDCVLLDVVDVARKHSLMTAPVLYGLPPNLVSNGETLDELSDELGKLLAAFPMLNMENVGRKTLAELRAFAETFDIWKIPSMTGYHVRLKWTRFGTDVFRIEYPWDIGAEAGFETIMVEPNVIGTYDTRVQWRRKGAKVVEAPRFLVRGARTAQEALTAGERYVERERRAKMFIVESSAGWRLKPASDAQKGLMVKLKIPHMPTISMGDASELINLAQARRALARM